MNFSWNQKKLWACRNESKWVSRLVPYKRSRSIDGFCYFLANIWRSPLFVDISESLGGCIGENHFHDRDLIPWDVIWGDLLDENLDAANAFPRHGDVRFILKFLPENLGLGCDLWARARANEKTCITYYDTLESKITRLCQNLVAATDHLRFLTVLPHIPKNDSCTVVHVMIWMKPIYPSRAQHEIRPQCPEPMSVRWPGGQC